MCKKKGRGVQITQNENLTSHKPTYPHPHVNHYIIVCPRATLMLNTYYSSERARAHTHTHLQNYCVEVFYAL